MRTANRLTVWLLLCAGFLSFTACPKEPARINMVVSAANNVNPDAGGKPLSVVVRIYQLKDKGRLETADYNSLVKADTILAEDVLEKQERVVQPGTQETIEVQANPTAAYVGVVALFRNPTGDAWRKIVPIPRSKLLKLNISLQEHSIDVVSSGK
jgi:type VI secretion system protein VasD